MKIKYNGQLERQESGCAPCGTKRKGQYGFVTAKSFILPSGQSKTFHMGQETEVSRADGEFLLSYNYEDANGLKRPVFEEVK